MKQYDEVLFDFYQPLFAIRESLEFAIDHHELKLQDFEARASTIQYALTEGFLMKFLKNMDQSEENDFVNRFFTFYHEAYIEKKFMSEKDGVYFVTTSNRSHLMESIIYIYQILFIFVKRFSETCVEENTGSDLYLSLLENDYHYYILSVSYSLLSSFNNVIADFRIHSVDSSPSGQAITRHLFEEMQTYVHMFMFVKDNYCFQNEQILDLLLSYEKFYNQINEAKFDYKNVLIVEEKNLLIEKNIALVQEFFEKWSTSYQEIVNQLSLEKNNEIN